MYERYRGQDMRVLAAEQVHTEYAIEDDPLAPGEIAEAGGEVGPVAAIGYSSAENSSLSFMATPILPPRRTLRVVIAHIGFRSPLERAIQLSGLVLISTSCAAGS